MAIVVGAGIAGLVAARKAAARGEDVLILEKEDGVGGRIRTKDFNGFNVDIGTQCLFEGYENTFGLIKAMGLEKEIKELKEPSTSVYRSGRFHTSNVKGLISFGSIREKYYAIKLLKRIKAIDRETNLSFCKVDSMEKYDELTLSDWVLENFNEDFLEYLIQPLVSGLTLTAPENISAAYGLPLLKHFMEKAFILEKGVGSLAEKIVENLPKNAQLKLNSEVEEISIEDNTVIGVSYKLNGEPISVNDKNVICSLPIPLLLDSAKGLPTDVKKNLSTVKYAPCVHAIIELKKSLNKTWGSFFSRKDFEGFSVITETQKKGAQFTPKSKSMLEVFLYGKVAEACLNKTSDEIFDLVLSDLKVIYPKIEDQTGHYDAIKMRYAMPIPQPGFLKLRNYFNLPVEGLKLCGDYMYWPSVESAVYSGLTV